MVKAIGIVISCALFTVAGIVIGFVARPEIERLLRDRATQAKQPVVPEAAV